MITILNSPKAPAIQFYHSTEKYEIETLPNAGTNMHVPLRKGDFDPGGFECLKQSEVQGALDLPMTGVANIHPDQQLKVQSTLAKFGEPYFRLRLWFHVRTGPCHGYHDLANVLRIGAIGGAHGHMQPNEGASVCIVREGAVHEVRIGDQDFDVVRRP